MPRISGLASVPFSIQTDLSTLLSRLTATRAGYLDNLSGGPVALASALALVSTAVGNVATDVGTLLARLTATRAGYLDNLSGGAVALQSTTSETASDAQGTSGTVYQLIAATASAIRRISFSFVVETGPNTGITTIYILTGGAGSEVTRGLGVAYTSATILSSSGFCTVEINLPTGTRIAWKAVVSSGQSVQQIACTVEEA